MRWHLSWMVQWTGITVYTCILKIRIFMSTRQWIYQNIQSGLVYYLGVLWDRHWSQSYWCCVPQHAASTHCSHCSSAVWRCYSLTTNGHPTFPSWCQGKSCQKFSRPMGRKQRTCWVPTTIARFNPIWFFLLRLLEGSIVQHKTNKTSRAPARNWIVFRILPSNNLVAACQPVARSSQLYREANGNNFEHLY